MTIRNDASRPTAPMADPRRARAVVARQGQVLLDTDFNDLSRHLIDRVETGTRDATGSPARLAVPADAAGFAIDGATTISAGRGYMAGWLVENDAPRTLTTQPHPFTGAMPAGSTAFALKALIRLIDPVEDPNLADVALADAQASGRGLIDWQVLPFALPATPPVTCSDILDAPAWKAMAAASTGRLAFIEQTVTASTDPCSLSPGGGYSRYENLLYRIEVHGGTQVAATADGPRFGLQGLRLKLSRRNASLMARITGVNGAELGVTPPALDPRNWFAPGLYAEIVSIHDDIASRPTVTPERLFRVARATDDLVTLVEDGGTTIAASGLPATGLDTDPWFLRLWDAFPAAPAPAAAPLGMATVGAPDGSGIAPAIDLGDGLAVQLAGGAAATFRRGDHWTCVVRADGSVAWPAATAGDHHQVPHGPQIRYAPLAIVAATGAIEDCRIPIATLTDRLLLYRGGDGQAITTANNAGVVPLPARLRVAVMRGEHPVAGAPVTWSMVGDAAPGTLGATATTTGPDGVSDIVWSVAASDRIHLHQVQAVLADAPQVPPILFSATVAAPATQNGCSTYVIVEGSDWVATLRSLKPGEDASVCFQRGVYATAGRVVLKGLGHITLSGQGEATRIVGKRGECVIAFEECDSVTLHDLRADTLDTRDSDDPGAARHRDGTITIRDCISAHVHHATLRCGGDIATTRTCLTISGSEQRPVKSVTVTGNRFLAGFLQDGVLVTDATRVTIQGNEFTAARRSASLTDARILGSRTWQAMARRMLVTDPTDAVQDRPDLKRLRLGKFVAEFSSTVPQPEWDRMAATDAAATVASAAEFQTHVDGLFSRAAEQPALLPSFARTMLRLPQGSSQDVKLALLAPAGIVVREADAVAQPGAGRVTIAAGNYAVTFSSPLGARDWKQISDQIVARGPDSYDKLLHEVEAMAARIVADAKLRQRLTSADPWYKARWTPAAACGRQAITCGGVALGDVGVEGNRVDGFMQGVHVGTSAEPQKPVRVIANARIAHNDLYLTKPAPDHVVPFGLFLGNAGSGRIDRNLIAPAEPVIDGDHQQGIRVWGHIGPFLMIRENEVRIGRVAIRVKPLDNPARDGETMWLVADNLSFRGGIVAPPEVTQVNNRRIYI